LTPGRSPEEKNFRFPQSILRAAPYFRDLFDRHQHLLEQLSSSELFGLLADRSATFFSKSNKSGRCTSAYRRFVLQLLAISGCPETK